MTKLFLMIRQRMISLNTDLRFPISLLFAIGQSIANKIASQIVYSSSRSSSGYSVKYTFPEEVDGYKLYYVLFIWEEEYDYYQREEYEYKWDAYGHDYGKGELRTTYDTAYMYGEKRSDSGEAYGSLTKSAIFYINAEGKIISV